MAFMGIFLGMVIVFVVVISISTFTGGILFTASAVMKRNGKKAFVVPLIFGCVFMLPLVSTIVLFISSVIETKVEHSQSLAYNVSCGNYSQAERLLKKGVSPDCTAESNEPAKDGEQTLLALMCENGGFWDSFDDPKDSDFTEDEEKMFRLLIEYGADVNSVSYRHQKESSNHRVTDEYSYYLPDDECGYTPLMYAVRYRHPEMVKILVENGADVNYRDFCGFTPVMTIADNLDDEDGEEMLLYLIENGATLSGYTEFGQDIAFLAFRQTTATYPFDNDGIIEIIKKYYPYYY